MMFEELFRDISQSKQDLMSFGRLVGGIFAVLGVAALWRDNQFIAVTLMSAGGSLMIGAVLAPSRLKTIHRVWMSAAMIMGHIMGLVILSILFYVVISPLGIIMKLLGKQNFNRFERGTESYWRKPSKDAWAKETFKRQF